MDRAPAGSPNAGRPVPPASEARFPGGSAAWFGRRSTFWFTPPDDKNQIYFTMMDEKRKSEDETGARHTNFLMRSSLHMSLVFRILFLGRIEFQKIAFFCFLGPFLGCLDSLSLVFSAPFSSQNYFANISKYSAKNNLVGCLSVQNTPKKVFMTHNHQLNFLRQFEKCVECSFFIILSSNPGCKSIIL